MSEARSHALALLRRCATPAGFVAAADDVANYRRVWARDGVVCGLAAVAERDEGLIDALAGTLATLRAAQGPYGEIPSNVTADGQVSFGMLAGRVDAPLWYALGVGALAAVRPEAAAEHRHSVSAALRLATIWEFNGRGLVYAPAGGTWADELPQHGYLLSVQALRLLALRACARAFDETAWAGDAERVAGLVADNYWLQGEAAGRYHPRAFAAASNPGHWASGFHPGGYETRFDGLANALALLAGLGHVAAVAATLSRIAAELGTWLTPAIWPPVRPDDPAWPEVETYARHEFRNRPGEYHNGGCWPMVSGFMAAGLAIAGRDAEVVRIAEAIDEANERGAWGFYEHHHATEHRPLGVRATAWSAAGTLIARNALAGRPVIELP